MPNLSAEEVESFVALDELGWNLFRAGDRKGAEAAFRRQIAIYSMNPEPYVSLALLEASRDRKKAAVEWLREAVVRGFTDLPRIERSEAWSRMPRSTAFLKLQDAIPAMQRIERDWPDWGSFQVARPPSDLDRLLRQYFGHIGRIEEMAPALGPRMKLLWVRTVDRAVAAMLESYVRKRPDAPDLEKAVSRLMDLYAGGPLRRWQRISRDVADPLSDVATLVLDKYPESPMRPAALVASALTLNSRRDKKGALSAESAQSIRDALGEVLSRYPDSPLASSALVGLVRIEAETGRSEHAAAQYAAFRKQHAKDREVLHRVQWDLGALGLKVGGLPEFHATTMDGEPVGLDELSGKTVVLDFWATWCAPCVEGFPALRKIDERYGDDVVVLGINMDWSDDLSTDALREWIAAQNVPGDHVHDGQAWDSELVKAFGVREIPFNVVVAADGDVVAVNQHGKKLERAVKGALETQ
jgi:thiol-disulfide isomerase/thioredoxin